MWTMVAVIVVMSVVMPALTRGDWSGRRRRRLRGGWDDDGASAETIAELRRDAALRDADMEALHTRVAELENRLDFTERMLAQHREHPGLADRSASR